MFNKRALWALGLVGAMIIGFAVYWLSPESGEKEFTRAIEAVKQVRSYRFNQATAPRSSRHTEGHGEMNCLQGAFHQVTHVVDQDLIPSDFVEDIVRLNSGTFQRADDGTWRRRSIAEGWEKPEQLCGKLSAGGDMPFFPDLNHMLTKGMFRGSSTKIVNGVKCREWKLDVVEYGNGLEGRTVCLGVDDHLPYEVTSDYDRSRATFTDYNVPIQVIEPSPVAVSDSDSAGTPQ